VDGTIVGFRFPEYSGTVEVSGFHLHFATADRTRGGHVLDCRTARATAWVDPGTDLHVELPPGVSLDAEPLDNDVAEAIDRVERGG
jgi:acetolactate decarboxylase